MHKLRSLRSTCAKYHPSLCSPFIYSVVSNDSVSGQWGLWSDCVYAQAYLDLRCPHKPEDMFSQGEAHMIWKKKKNNNNNVMNVYITKHFAGLGGSSGCAVWPEIRRSRVQPPPRSQHCNILSLRLIMKYFLRSFSPFRWFKKGNYCQFLSKECAQYWLTA